MFKDTYLQPHLPDDVLDFAIVLDLARDFIPEAQEVTAVDESGGEARTYAIDDDIILKTQRPHRLRPRTSLERETMMLKHLHKHTDVSVPRVLGYAKRGNLVEYIVMTRLAGSPLSRTSVQSENLHQVLYQHGRSLRKIHTVTQHSLLESGLFPNDTNASCVAGRFLYRLEHALQTLPGVADKEKLVAVKLGEEIVSGIPSSLELVALHSNPYREHTFVFPDMTYSGIIDFGDSYISHPVNDLRRWSFTERRQLLRGYGSLGDLSESFMQVWNINYQLDAILDILRKKLTLSDIGQIDDLLQWE